MEIIRNYLEVDEIFEILKKIADNLEEIARIMQFKNPITMTPEKAKAVLNEWYGNMVLDEVSKNFWAENEKGKLLDEIQDLKLENDRLKQRVNLMYDFICSISCTLKVCRDCKLNRPDKFDELGAKCAYLQGSEGLKYIRSEAYNLIKQLEEL